MGGARVQESTQPLVLNMITHDRMYQTLFGFMRKSNDVAVGAEL